MADLLRQAAEQAEREAEQHQRAVEQQQAALEATLQSLEATRAEVEAQRRELIARQAALDSAQAEIEDLRRRLAANDPPAPTPDAAENIRVIARWDAVPHQDVPTTGGPFNVGVVAFHMAGIDRVEFDWDGHPGPEATATEPRLNPRTGVVEYWITLDPATLPAGPIELSAVVHPRVGIPRTLAGPLDASSVHNGSHGLPLAIVGPADDRVTRVGPERAYKTIGDALNSFGSADVGGRILELDPGTYAFGGGRHPYATTNHRWLTVRPAHGVDRADVRIVRGSSFRTGKVRLHNVTLVGEDVVVGRPEDAVWLDDCHGIGSGVETNGGTITASATGPMVYVTGGTYGHNRNGIRRAVFTRGVTIDVVGGVAFGGGFVANSRALAYDNGDTDFHGDVWHWFERIDNPRTTDNAILYGLDVAGWSTQGVYVEEPNQGAKEGQYVKTLGSLAIVDVKIAGETVADALVLSAGVGYLHAERVTLEQDVSLRRGEWGPMFLSDVTAARWLGNPPPVGSLVVGLELTHPDQRQSVVNASTPTPVTSQ